MSMVRKGRLKMKNDFTLKELMWCIYWHFIHHPSIHLANEADSSELRLAAISYGVKDGWLDLDECMSAQCGMNVYTLKA